MMANLRREPVTWPAGLMDRAGATLAAGVLLLAGAVGCAGQDPGATKTTDPAATSTATAAGTTPTATTGADVTYTLPASLCAAVDDSALKDLFPNDGGRPIADSGGLCATSRSSAAMAVSLSVDAELLPTAAAAKQYFDASRRLARSTPTDIPGAGSGAFWTGGAAKVQLISYHGNLVLTLSCEPVSSQHPLPGGVPERLARVAAGTFAKLAP